MEELEGSAVERAQAGDADAFRLLVEQHSRNVFRLAFRITGNEQDAEDVVQETFLRAYRQLGKCEARSSFATCALNLFRCREAASGKLALIRTIIGVFDVDTAPRCVANAPCGCN